MTLNLARAAGATPGGLCRCECGCLARGPRYPSDLTDEQWAVLEPLLPVMLCLTVLGGRPEKHRRRTMIDAMFYVADNGCKWRALPADFPPWKTVYGMFARWKKDGVLADITDRLRGRVRQAAGRDAEPSAGIADAQSVHESAEGVVPAATSGFDHHKKVNGRKRHLLTDTLGLLIGVTVTAANAPDRAGAAVLLKRARGRGRHRLARVWADNAYNGDWTAWAQRELGITIEVVAQPRGQQGFQVLPRRWVIERTHAWTTRRRRCARDYERLPAHHAAWVHLAAIFQMTRRLAATQEDNPAPAHPLGTGSIGCAIYVSHGWLWVAVRRENGAGLGACGWLGFAAARVVL
jgi:putative transposase